MPTPPPGVSARLRPIFDHPRCYSSIVTHRGPCERSSREQEAEADIRGSRHAGNRLRTGSAHRAGHGDRGSVSGEPRPRQVRCKTVRGDLRGMSQEPARPRQRTAEFHAVVLSAPALHLERRLRAGPHRLSAIARYAARQGEGPDRQVSAEGQDDDRDGQIDERRSAAPAGGDPEAVGDVIPLRLDPHR